MAAGEMNGCHITEFKSIGGKGEPWCVHRGGIPCIGQKNGRGEPI